MSNEEQAPQQESPAPAAEPVAKKKVVDKIVLRPYPKVVFFYLTWIASLVCGIITSLYQNSTSAAGVSASKP